MTTRKRRRKPAPKRSNSNIQTAQQAADKERAARVLEVERQKANKTGAAGQTKLSARTGPMATRDAGIDQDKIAERDNTAGRSMSEAANKIAGLASGIIPAAQAQARQRAIQENIAHPNPLADASLYGANTQARAERLGALFNAKNQAHFTQLATAGKAVWMGYTHNRVKLRNSGPERMDENGNDTTIVGAGDDVRSTDELMSWLADPKTLAQITDTAKKAGFDIQNYDDVAKLWQSVVTQAAQTYSTTKKRVTPWALIALRGKTLVNGRPGKRTGISTTVEEMDPAQAKVMIQNTLQQELGRDPKQSEIDDFISKAQTIAQQNPLVQRTTQDVGFDGQPLANTTEVTQASGGQDVVNAKAQLEAQRLAESAPDYAQFQAAGVMMPWLNEALASPF